MDIKKRIFKLFIMVIVAVSVFFILAELWGAQRGETGGKDLIAGWMQDTVMMPYLPAVCMMNDGGTDKITYDMYYRMILTEYPVFRYEIETEHIGETAAESDYARLIMLEGSDEDRKSIEEDELEYGEDAMHLEKSMEEALLKENGMYAENQEAQPEKEAQDEPQEKDPAQSASAGFVPVQNKSYSYRWDDLQSYEMLIKAFYAVDSTTKAGEELLQADKLRLADMRVKGGSDQPQILIYHTHSQEAFADSVPGDGSTGIVGVGEHLAALLRDRYGYNVLHYTESFDRESRDYAYSNALPVIEGLLEQYPSIEVVIDLHRDAVPEDRRLTVDLQGRPTAQFMFFNGLSRTAQGQIEYLENPYLDDNLAFSFQMQTACNEYYPGLARRIYLKAYRYNMHLCPKTLLIELGAQNNTVEEAMNACDPLAHVLDLVLSGTEPQR